MRVIAGTAKGTALKTPGSGTRPMTGRARESLFSILSARLADASVLDLYAGSGSLGLEALSRGARTAVFVERDRKAAALIAENIDTVGLGGKVMNTTVTKAVSRLAGTFDIVFVDPPYADGDDSVAATLAALEPVVADRGLVVLHRQRRSVTVVPDFLSSVDERHYGDAVVTMMERIAT